ncbi:hypothetical protein BDZ94DRAFT_1247497 [Collybia nuda]|uniref:Uncharacterized protein n=1 Tax=Collybia nuda TaxID=64659 RepID=A0A9P6CNF5_9AGAR|nr:hypothetical protein BDZ94DRAFT_1247497 [Collybia nuda]
MLRWCQSTVRAWDGGGSSTLSSIRFRSSSALRGFTRARLEDGKALSASRDSVIGRSGQNTTQPTMCGDSEFARQILVPGGQKGSGRGTVGDTQVPVLVNSTNSMPSTFTPGRGDPVVQLNRILTPSILLSAPVPAQTLKRLYILVKSQDQLHRLTSKQLTRLLSLMGSLSLPAPRAPCIYFSKLISHIDKSSFQTFWPFILEIAQDKQKLGWKLDGTDRYWIMRAHLMNVTVAEGESLRSGDSRLHALSVATEQYLRIRRHTPDPEIHLPYLKVLFSLGSIKHVTALVRHLCGILESTLNPHSHFVDLLCHVLLKHGHSFPPNIKGRILSMVHTRLTKFSSISVPSQKYDPPLTGKVFDDTSKRHKRIALDVSDLISALGTAVFPISSIKVAPTNLQQWAHDQASETFAPRLSWETQWDNLMLFAISRMPEIPVVGSLPTTKGSTGVSGIDWKTVFVLATLHGTLATMNPASLVEARSSIRNIVHPLWRMWKSKNAGSPDIATSIIVASFYRAAAITMDALLTEECFQYCRLQELFGVQDASKTSKKLQTQDLLIAHVLATISCHGGSWSKTFSTLEPMLTTKARDKIIESLLWYYTPRDVEDMFRLYLFSKKNSVNLPVGVVHAVSISLASSHTPETAIPFLHHPQFSRIQVESLLGAILRALQFERRRRIDSTLADRIGQIMLKLFARERPSNQDKYPIRFFFSILIASGHPAKAVYLVEAIYHQAPAFFTTRLFLRIIRTLVRYRELRLATRVFRLIPLTSSRASDNIRRKLSYLLDRAGSDTLAKTFYKNKMRPKSWRTCREALGRLVSFRSRSQPKYRFISFRSIPISNPSNGPAIKHAVSMLIGARRSLAAYKLYARSHHLLSTATKVSTGNIILHGSLLHSGRRNGRLVRHILRTKDLLEKSCAFTPDRVTINVIIKAILGWKSVFDPPKIKTLFDQIIRSGYPVSPRWRRQYGVPFGTPLSSPSQTFGLSSLQSTISFERHVRPMYKMFIKTFYSRHDIRAAKMIIGILKEEEILVNEKKEARERARRRGLAEK